MFCLSYNVCSENIEVHCCNTRGKKKKSAHNQLKTLNLNQFRDRFHVIMCNDHIIL